VNYLLYGEDDFSLQEALSSIKEDVRPADLRDLNTTELDAAQVSLDLLVATCDTMPFMADKRLVIVRGLLSLFERRVPSQPRARGDNEPAPGLGQWQGLSEYLAGVPESTDLVFVEGRLSNANPLLATIRPQVTVRTFPPPNPGELRQWIRGRATAEGIEIEPGAVDALADAIGGDLRVIAAEIQKLSLYRAGQAVRQEDVEEMVSYAKEANIFAAVDAVIEGRPGVAIGLVHRLLQSGRSPGQLLSMVARQVRLLILAKDLKARRVPHAEQGRRLGLAGYPLRKIMEQEPRFSGQRLAEIHRKLLEADLSIKSTGASEELVLDVLIAEVSSPEAGGTVRREAGYRR
jgi:DNA polymerase-3 subunit delta